MDDYLNDREILAKFVDELIKNKALPVGNAEELNTQREAAIKELDKRIGMAIFGKFTEAQNTEFNQLLDRGDTTDEEFAAFFAKAGIDIEQTTKEAAEAFAKEFLGGQNA